MNHTLEETIAFHCAPALVGLKPANMISCCRMQYRNLDTELHHLNAMLNSKGLFFQPICECGVRILLLVYRKQVLYRHLRSGEVAEFLKENGYPVASPDAVLRHFQERLEKSDCFPHESGVILGYPVKDVQSFLEDGGKGCKLTGYWKVYHDEEKARKLFCQYTNCRNTLFSLVSSGVSIPTLFNAA